MPKYKKKDILEEIYSKNVNINRIVINKIVNDFIEALRNKLKKEINDDEEIINEVNENKEKRNKEDVVLEIRGLGTFKGKIISKKKVYNFSEKKIVEYSNSYRIYFKPSKKFN